MSEISSSNSIVVTGIGALTATGRTAQEAFTNILEGQTGIRPIQQWDISDWAFPLGAEILNADPRELISDRKLLKLISRQDVIGLNAVRQALDDSEILNYRQNLDEASQKAFNDRTGVFVGSPGNRYEQQYDFLPVFAASNGNMKVFAEKIFDLIHPMWLLRILPNNVLAYAGIQYGFKGANQNIANHAIGGMQAIAEASRAIRMGLVDRAVVIGYECGVEPEGQIYYGSLGVLSATGLRPFDRSHDGTILAEGAGCIILERRDVALERHAKCYGEILGDAVSSEAQGVFSIHPNGDGVKQTVEAALVSANIDANEIGMLVAHGNGNPVSDNSEAIAFTEIFKEKSVPTTAFKWSLGHTLAAAGVIETIMTLLSLQNACVPGIAPLQEPAQECSGLLLSRSSQTPKTPNALLISRGFSSVNSCLVVRGAV